MNSENDPGPIEFDDEWEREHVEEASSLPSRLVYEVIRRDGEEELERPNRSLVWSGVAAGVLIAFSVIGEAVFRTHLPEMPGRYLVENLGYTLGFLLVVLGRMQLFTENTITTVLPVMVSPSARICGRMARMWSIVLAANVVGAFFIAGLMAWTPILPPDMAPAIRSLSEHATGMGAVDGFFRGIPAGILIAAIVWMRPQVEHAHFWVVLVFTWAIAAGDFTHIVAGSVEMAYLIMLGELGGAQAVFGFFLPVLAGNVVGGTAIFAALVYGQVKDELRRIDRLRNAPE